jgi:hypothetical protein
LKPYLPSLYTIFHPLLIDIMRRYQSFDIKSAILKYTSHLQDQKQTKTITHSSNSGDNDGK